MKNYHKLMEMFWLVTFVLSTIASIYIHLYTDQVDYMLYVLPLAALGMYFLRRYVRKKASHE